VFEGRDAAKVGEEFHAALLVSVGISKKMLWVFLLGIEEIA